MGTDLKQKLSKLPVAPGVYFHKNQAGEIIYVGKAAVLKNRVRQYFQNSKKDKKTAALVDEIADTDWITVDTEMDALFLESEMVKRYKPKWNILLRDDKSVSYVRIDQKSAVPYVSFTRNPADDKATYIGPFYGKSAIERALRILRHIFPYYDKPYTGKKTLNTDLGLTPGIEIEKTTPKEYQQNLKNLIRYLKGDRKKLLKDLEKDMKNASQNKNYELAAKLRDQLNGLKELQKKIVFSDKEFLDISSDQALKELQNLLNLEKPPRRIEGYDISHQSGKDTVGSMVVFINGTAARSKYRKFKIRTSKNDDLKSLQEVITRRLKHQEWDYPDLIIVDGGKNQVNAILPLVEPLGIPIIGRDKSGDHSHSAKVKLVIPAYSELRAFRSPAGRELAPAARGDGPAGRGPQSEDVELPSSSPCQAPDPLGLECFELPPSSHIARLIARVDEEAHRFAINYHTLLKQKNMLK